jgi:hypothetical protein
LYYDTTTLEIIPRNAINLTNTVAGNVNDFAENNHMKLNHKKCKEMAINPLEYNTTVLRPINIGNTTIEKNTLLIYMEEHVKDYVLCVYYVKLGWNSQYVEGIPCNYTNNIRICCTSLAGYT